MPLRRTALHLSLDVTRVDGLADILDGGEAQDIDLAGFGIDCDIDDVAGVRTADAARLDRSGGADRPARAACLGGNLPEGDAFAGGGIDALLVRYAGGVRIEQLGRADLHLIDDFLARRRAPPNRWRRSCGCRR